jgi:hypothetical protein
VDRQRLATAGGRPSHRHADHVRARVQRPESSRADRSGRRVALADLIGPHDERSWQLLETAAERGDTTAMAKLIAREPDKWFAALVSTGDAAALRRAAEVVTNPNVAKQLRDAATQIS